MPRIRLLALTVISALLVGAGLLWSGEEPVVFETPLVEHPPLLAAEETPALVDSEILERRAQEPELIDKARVSTTSTTTSSTTSTTTTTSTTAAPATTAADQTGPTSPPTTQAPTTTTTAASGQFLSGAESEFASSINSYRGSNGMSSLSRSGSLDSYARSWAEQMADNGGISHSDIGSLLGQWSGVGENVGVGGSVGGLFQAFVDSPDHESNIVGDFTHMGIGVYQDPDGVLWTAHVFAR